MEEIFSKRSYVDANVDLLTMFIWREGAGVYINVRIDFDGRHMNVAVFENSAE